MGNMGIRSVQETLNTGCITILWHEYLNLMSAVLANGVTQSSGILLWQVSGRAILPQTIA